MLAKISIVALAGAAAVAALDARSLHSIMPRQLSQSTIPSACQDTCSSALSIYNACLNGDTNTCLSVCQSDTYNGFIGCFNCILQDTPGVTQTEVDELNSAIAQLQAACAGAGQTVTGASLTAPSGAATGSGSATGSVASVTGGASFTSASGGLTIGSSGAASAATAAVSSAASVVSGAQNSATSKASSAASGVASSAASATGAAGIAAELPNMLSVALGLVGVGAGAAFIL
ncbi:hypothetical protein DB88DRAFT_481447 [Papiliotrema laurentii]|uniref:Extracellular membrane protein CFEM domain-containing protein n=1 Tax=Papiliotrema laurentii TaxID=5418 RepID=A0AAD9FU66_PAPLA|nr:hypothetical protein DB88DRAFT_481447 [Papiliotrema laurentii]